MIYHYFSKIYNKCLYKSHDHSTPIYTMNGKEGWARVVEAYDADSIKIVFKKGRRYKKYILRLAGIDAPELATRDLKEKEMGYRARDRLISLITHQDYRELPRDKKEIVQLLNSKVYLVYCRFYEIDKYGRVLIDISRYKNGKTYNQILVDEGYAKIYNGGKKELWDTSHITLTPDSTRKLDFNDMSPQPQFIIQHQQMQYSPLQVSAMSNNY